MHYIHIWMTQKATLLLICYAWKPINDPNITAYKSAVKIDIKSWLVWGKAATLFQKRLIRRKRSEKQHIPPLVSVLLQCYWSFLTYLKKDGRIQTQARITFTCLRVHARTQAHTQAHTDTHKTKHTFWSLYSSGNINRPLEAFLNIHWRGIKHSLLATCKTITPQTDKQTQTTTKQAYRGLLNPRAS